MEDAGTLLYLISKSLRLVPIIEPKPAHLQLQSNRGNRGLRGSLQQCRQTLPVPPTPTQPMPRRTPSRTSSPPWRTLPRAPRDG